VQRRCRNISAELAQTPHSMKSRIRYVSSQAQEDQVSKAQRTFCGNASASLTATPHRQRRRSSCRNNAKSSQFRPASKRPCRTNFSPLQDLHSRGDGGPFSGIPPRENRRSFPAGLRARRWPQMTSALLGLAHQLWKPCNIGRSSRPYFIVSL